MATYRVQAPPGYKVVTERPDAEAARRAKELAAKAGVPMSAAIEQVFKADPALKFRYQEWASDAPSSLHVFHAAVVDLMAKTGLDLDAATTKVMATDHELAKRVMSYFVKLPPAPASKVVPIDHGKPAGPAKKGAIA